MYELCALCSICNGRNWQARKDKNRKLSSLHIVRIVLFFFLCSYSCVKVMSRKSWFSEAIIIASTLEWSTRFYESKFKGNENYKWMALQWRKTILYIKKEEKSWFLSNIGQSLNLCMESSSHFFFSEKCFLSDKIKLSDFKLMGTHKDIQHLMFLIRNTFCALKGILFCSLAHF